MPAHHVLKAAILATFCLSAPAWSKPVREAQAPLVGAAGSGSACAPGFQPIEGTRTCVRIGGQVRAEAVAGRGQRRPLGADGRVRFEARTQTDYGPARAVIQVRGGNIQRGSNPYAQ